MIQINPSFSGDDLPDSTPLFEPGQIVRHLRYGYRGLIVAVDPYCKAPPDWYMANKTQPDRRQPWYHVLVDGTSTVTYPAEVNLAPADDCTQIRHPLVTAYFSEFVNGRYVRNEAEWPQ